MSFKESLMERDGVIDCRKESKKDPSVKLNCGNCEACKAIKNSREITNNHVKGRFCKNSNQCSICSMLKHELAFLRHLGGSCSAKCKWCSGIYKMPFMFQENYCKLDPDYAIESKQRHMKYIFKMLYREFGTK